MFQLNGFPLEKANDLPLSSSIIPLWVYKNSFPLPATRTLALGESLSDLFGLNMKVVFRSNLHFIVLFLKWTAGSRRTRHTDKAYAALRVSGNSRKLVTRAGFTLRVKYAFFEASRRVKSKYRPWKWQYLYCDLRPHIEDWHQLRQNTSASALLFVHQILPSSALLQNYSGCCGLPCP